ncbi:MAG: hypothetical protein LW724_09155 [Planctomycetaceae bacterium]|nr:hypothetical protein [Planctomycetaceae bacterium]
MDFAKAMILRIQAFYKEISIDPTDIGRLGIPNDFMVITMMLFCLRERQPMDKSTMHWGNPYALPMLLEST